MSICCRCFGVVDDVLYVVVLVVRFVVRLLCSVVERDCLLKIPAVSFESSLRLLM